MWKKNLLPDAEAYAMRQQHPLAAARSGQNEVAAGFHGWIQAVGVSDEHNYFPEGPE